MATVRLKYRPSCVATKEGSLYYQVIHNRVARPVREDTAVAGVAAAHPAGGA